MVDNHRRCSHFPSSREEEAAKRNGYKCVTGSGIVKAAVDPLFTNLQRPPSQRVSERSAQTSGVSPLAFKADVPPGYSRTSALMAMRFRDRTIGSTLAPNHLVLLRQWPPLYARLRQEAAVDLYRCRAAPH